MARFAVVDGNSVVVNVIEAASQDVAEAVTGALCVGLANDAFCDLGFRYVPTSQTFVSPMPELASEGDIK